ncbi:serine hydrolase domain-containing protein [Streptomyces thermocarboxydovorans]|uniref:serine hydrolase domain-containing protein n=1 Tax=Streptomyces thermocarboxydovorans TaxID=59298 RepID=UPI0031DAE300
MKIIMTRVPTCILSSFQAPQILHGHSPDLFVQIGSLTKTLTATVLTALADGGILGFDDPLELFLPAPRGTGITLRHLAEHTSGLPRLPPGIRGRDPYAGFDAKALDSVVRHLDTLVTAPAGSIEEYSNLGYALLGAALVAATATPYEELCTATSSARSASPTSPPTAVRQTTVPPGAVRTNAAPLDYDRRDPSRRGAVGHPPGHRPPRHRSACRP